MPSLHPAHTVALHHPPVRVGRLLPLDGVALRPHPDGVLLRQFLHELDLQLAATETMHELADVPNLPASVQMAMRAAASHVTHLAHLVADFAQYGRLEADTVRPRPLRTALSPWLDAQISAMRPAAERLGIVLEVVHRSFLPSHVELDTEMAADALAAVLRVALHRAHPGVMHVRTSYQHGQAAPVQSRLVLDITSRGGGFAEVDQGYVFTPFAVRDGASRPLLGLAIAQRLCQLLGGELRVESPGLSACTYEVVIAAAPSADAAWTDPMGASGVSFGPVYPGSVLFVEAGSDHRLLGAPALQRVGYRSEGVECPERVLERLADPSTAWSALVLDRALCGDTLSGLVGAVREQGFLGRIVVILGSMDGDPSLDAVDAIVRRPVTGAALLAALASKR